MPAGFSVQLVSLSQGLRQHPDILQCLDGEHQLGDAIRLCLTQHAPGQFAELVDDVVDKFRKLTRRVLSEARAERIAELVLAVEALHDIGVLAKALAEQD